MRRLRRLVPAVLLVLLAVALSVPSADPPPPTRSLREFGPTATPAAAQDTYAKALGELGKAGGILVVTGDDWKKLKDVSLQTLERTPAAPAETKRWKTGNGVTVVVVGGEQTTVEVPPLSGLKLERHLRLPAGDSLPHWGTHPLLTIENELVYGSTSYLDWLQAPVEKGENRRFYVPTVRGLHPGMFLNIHGHSGYGGGVTRACIKALGWDDEKKQHYLVADTSQDHKAGAILHNKSNTGLVHMTQTSHNDNQTYDVKVIRNQYAHGDTYVYYCDFNYMSNVHSAAGDENGNCYAAFIRSKEDNFRGTVEAVDWDAGTVKFKGERNANTLGDSRPLINLNPKKAVTAGTVLIVAPDCYHDYADKDSPENCVFEGKSYATRLVKNEVTGTRENKLGGLIRGDKDCPWTADVVGRFFAVTTPEEKTPKGGLRWYEVSAFRANADGTKEIEIKRYWWGAKSAGGPNLYSPESYTRDGHVRPLTYVIAPGTYVNDVSRAVPGGDRGGQHLLGVAPYRDARGELDFAAGDPVEQAIGPDPFKPQVMRAWMWEDVPGLFPSAVFDVRNLGAASRHGALVVGGGAVTLEDSLKRKEMKPAWDNVVVVDAAATVGLNLKGDFANAGILFHQPGADAAVKWKYYPEAEKPAKHAALTVSRDAGELTFRGTGVRTGGPVAEVAGLSGDKTQAKNLRGKGVPVEAKATTLRVKFPRPEADGDYAVFVEQSWLSNRAITEKGPDGFTVTFAAAAPDGARLDWMIVR